MLPSRERERHVYLGKSQRKPAKSEEGIGKLEMQVDPPARVAQVGSDIARAVAALVRVVQGCQKGRGGNGGPAGSLAHRGHQLSA